MRGPLPVWLAAVVPATLAGHALAYALCACGGEDAHHSWMVPALESSIAALIVLILARTGAALVKSRILTHTAEEQSLFQLFVRLGPSQTLLFVAVEAAERSPIELREVLVQICIALVAAFLISVFARLLSACEACTRIACAYLQRMLQGVASFVSRCPQLGSLTLASHAGTSRFQRPPPGAVAVPF